MYQRILVAVDNSELSQQAFQKALAIAKAFTAKLQIIYVVSPLIAEYQDTTPLVFSDGLYPETLDSVGQEEFATIQEQGWDLLRSFQDQARQTGVIAEATEQIGQPEQEITQFAKDWNADLIVIGSHGRKGIGELILGSVSNYVSHHVPCSVLLVHQPEASQEESNNS